MHSETPVRYPCGHRSGADGRGADTVRVVPGNAMQDAVEWASPSALIDGKYSNSAYGPS